MKLIPLILSSSILLLLSACTSTPEGIVNESFPVAENSENSVSEPASSESTASFETAEISTGDFEDRVHKVSGQAKLLEVNGKKILRLEEFTTENGPALFIYLVKNSTGSPKGDDFVDLGSLKSTNGNFNYDVPDDINLKDYQSVSVWCKTFGVNFGTAVLK